MVKPHFIRQNSYILVTEVFRLVETIITLPLRRVTKHNVDAECLGRT